MTHFFQSSTRFATLIVTALLLITTSDVRALDETEKAPEAPAFEVPEGTVDELFQFINKVKQAPPAERSQEAIVAHLKAQVKAVIEACDQIAKQKPDDESQVRILMERFSGYQVLSQVDETAATRFEELITKHEKDKRPGVVKLVGGYKLKQRTEQLFTLPGKEQATLVKDLFAFIGIHGLDQQTLGIAQSLGDAFEQSETPQLGAVVYEGLAKELKKLENPGIASQIARMEAVARRLRLPGKFMKVNGTTAEGEEFDWAAYRGKVVLVDFWASWCGPCRAEIPNMKAQLEKYEDKGFAIVGINLDRTMQEYQSIVEREELTWVNLISANENERGWDNPLVVHYGISGIPTAILVDKQGKVVSMNARGEELNRLLGKMLP